MIVKFHLFKSNSSGVVILLYTNIIAYYKYNNHSQNKFLNLNNYQRQCCKNYSLLNRRLHSEIQFYLYPLYFLLYLKLHILLQFMQIFKVKNTIKCISVFISKNHYQINFCRDYNLSSPRYHFLEICTKSPITTIYHLYKSTKLLLVAAASRSLKSHLTLYM